MAQISKMSGTSWHVEEHYKTRVHTKNCVDCKYFQTEGRMCKKRKKKRMNMFRLTLQIIAITLIIYIDILLSLVKKQLTKIKSKRLSKKETC